jgi:hypothetical protein
MVGFPHSEIIGSKLIRSSPTLIAAYYVLHRLCTPRHPLNALKTLDRSHYQCPQHQHHPSPLEGSVTTSSGLSIANASLRRRLIGQIKLTRFHVASLFLPGVRVKRDKKPSLYDVERSAPGVLSEHNRCKLALLIFTLLLGGKWWSLTGSNRRHPACKAGALPAELRPQSFPTEPEMVGPGRLELPTSRLSGVRSNHLSYGPDVVWTELGRLTLSSDKQASRSTRDRAAQG